MMAYRYRTHQTLMEGMCVCVCVQTMTPCRMSVGLQDKRLLTIVFCVVEAATIVHEISTRSWAMEVIEQLSR
jgi:hypothetical protein